MQKFHCYSWFCKICVFYILIKLFFHITKKVRTKFKILKTKRHFKVKQKVFSMTFKDLSVTRNYFKPKSAPLVIFRSQKDKESRYFINSITCSSHGTKIYVL